MAETIQGGPYSQLETGLASPTVHPGHELGPFRNTQRSGGGGWKGDAEDGDTRFTHGL